MKPTILNREFQHPADNWYMIEPLGDHANKPAGIVQVIDADAAASIVNRFNADAAAGKLKHGSEMLIDHEHFKHDAEKETRAYGWLTKLENRADGIYAQIRWTTTGKAAVDGGDYRFFSSEYDPTDLKVLNDGKPKRVRPLKLDGLTLTNEPNNKGGRPITNRALRPATMMDGKCTCPDCDGDLDAVPDQADVLNCPTCQTKFATPSGAASNQKTKNRNNNMQKIATKLGLAAEASEEAILEAVTKIMNRNATLEPLAATNETLTNRVKELETEQVAGIFAECQVTDAKVINRLTPSLLPLENRQARLEYLADLNIKPGKAAPAERVLNRSSAAAAAHTTATATNGQDEAARVDKIRNRCSELTKSGLSFDAAWAKAVSENQPVEG